MKNDIPKPTLKDKCVWLEHERDYHIDMFSRLAVLYCKKIIHEDMMSYARTQEEKKNGK